MFLLVTTWPLRYIQSLLGFPPLAGNFTMLDIVPAPKANFHQHYIMFFNACRDKKTLFSKVQPSKSRVPSWQRARSLQHKFGDIC